MSEGIESIGGAVTGGLVARAVEPEAGEAGEEASVCLNCGTALIDQYCHHCGQKARLHRSLAAIWHDIAHSALHFEGKVWRTLPLLTWKPGELTRRYIAGERVRFVSPMAMFLFSVFLMFATFSALGGMAETGTETQFTEPFKTSPTPGDQDFDALGFQTGWPPLDAAIIKANENPSLLLYKLQANGYKFSWALIPISIPFVWMLFLHRRRYRKFRAYDHTVFVTYSIAFMSLGAIAVALLDLMGLGGPATLLAMLVPPIHMYRQLRGAYCLSRFSAAWRAFALAMCATIAAGLFFMLLLMIGVLA